jgi:hypothetical protein
MFLYFLVVMAIDYIIKEQTNVDKVWMENALKNLDEGVKIEPKCELEVQLNSINGVIEIMPESKYTDISLVSLKNTDIGKIARITVATMINLDDFPGLSKAGNYVKLEIGPEKYKIFSCRIG